MDELFAILDSIIKQEQQSYIDLSELNTEGQEIHICNDYDMDDVFAYCKECGKTIPNDIILNPYNINCYSIPRKKYNYSRNDMFIDNLYIFIGQLEPVLKKKNKEIYNLNCFISTLNKDDPLFVKKEIVKFCKLNKYNFLTKYINYFFIQSLTKVLDETNENKYNRFILKIESKDLLFLQEEFSTKTKTLKNIIFSKIIHSLLKDYGYDKDILSILLYPKSEENKTKGKAQPLAKIKNI